MKHFLRYSATLCLLAFCVANSHAVLTANTHNFHEMSGKTLAWPSGYTVGVTTLTPELTYTCGTSGTFGLADDGATVSLNLPGSGSYVTTAPAVENLTKIILWRTPANAANVDFYISSDDGDSWTQITSGISVDVNSIEVAMPSKGAYCLKIVRQSSGSTMYIKSITYQTNACNCLRVVTE